MFFRLVWIFIIIISSKISLAVDTRNSELDIKQLTTAVQNLTVAINSIEPDAGRIIATSQGILNILARHPQNLDRIAGIAQAVTSLNLAIREAMPTIENCAFFLGGSIIFASLSCTLPKLIKYCLDRYKGRQSQLVDEMAKTEHREMIEFMRTLKNSRLRSRI